MLMHKTYGIFFIFNIFLAVMKDLKTLGYS